MTRAARLFKLTQLLRQYRYPVPGKILAQKLEISLRTLYRDIAELQNQGAEIEGEAGLGFQLKPGFTLPPIMLTIDEIEALVLGARWVAKKTDAELKMAANNALAKISAVLPKELCEQLQLSGLMVGPGVVNCASDEDILMIRKAIQSEYKLNIHYQDAAEKVSNRAIWPLGLAYFESSRIIIAWCELREDFRHFRTDRVTHLECDNQKYPHSRASLLKKWRIANNIPE